MYSCGTPHMDEQRLDDQLEPVYSSSVLMQDVSWKTCRERWTIETGGDRGSGKSVLATRNDDDDDDSDASLFFYIFAGLILTLWLFLFIYLFLCS